MQLTEEEQAWLDNYRKALAEEFPGLVEEILVFGSKARGEAAPDSDLDVLLIIRNQAAHLKRDLRRTGYLLAATSDAVPSILAYSKEEWESRKRSGSPFRKAVERDAVKVL
jgi:predicted nucleotidyltransferase